MISLFLCSPCAKVQMKSMAIVSVSKNFKSSLARLIRRKSKSLPADSAAAAAAAAAHALNHSPRHARSPVLNTSITTTEEDENVLQQLQQVFNHFDSDKDGKISCEELMEYFASVRECVTHDMAKRVIKDFDSDGDDLLEFGDFLRLVREGNNKEELDHVLRAAFQMFEVDKGSGCITPKGLQHMLRRLGELKSEGECAAMIRVFDLDGNGFLDFHEFHHMMSRT